MARKMETCVPQRHFKPSSAVLISASVALGFFFKNAAEVMTQPLMQWPHCGTCSSKNATCMGCGFSGVPRPARVVTFLPFTAETGMTQERTG